MASSNSVSCNSGGFHTDNSYYRRFDLPSFGIDGDFEVCNVTIGVEVANDGGGAGQPLTVNLYTWPTFPANTGTLVGTADVTVQDQALSVLSIPVTATLPAGSALVVEVFTPSGIADSNEFFIGTNTAGETAPSYIKAASCGINSPVTIASSGIRGS